MKTRLASLVFSMQRLGCVDSMYMFIGHNNEARSLPQMIGVDTDALAKQVAERKEREAADKTRDA